MQSPGHLISLVASVPLVLVGLATQTFASSQSNRNSNSPQYVELAPEPQSNERVKSYPNHKLASCELYRQGVGYNAYGIEGQRLCYGKTEGMTNFVLAENEPEADGSYVGNDSMSSINIGKFLCSKGIETDGKKLELNCLDKRPVYAETKIEKVEALDAGKYNVTFSYEGCIDDKVRVQQVCFELYPDQSPDTASLY
ncbi:MAG: hypothetical protein NTV34_07265, partial [Proteobacteria bacterium]|nr:hypothetical protein [Pseudomonadota bacterium]